MKPTTLAKELPRLEINRWLPSFGPLRVASLDENIELAGLIGSNTRSNIASFSLESQFVVAKMRYQSWWSQECEWRWWRRRRRYKWLHTAFPAAPYTSNADFLFILLYGTDISSKNAFFPAFFPFSIIPGHWPQLKAGAATPGQWTLLFLLLLLRLLLSLKFRPRLDKMAEKVWSLFSPESVASLCQNCRSSVLPLYWFPILN